MKRATATELLEVGLVRAAGDFIKPPVTRWRQCPTCDSPAACKYHDECHDTYGYSLDGEPWHKQPLCGERVTEAEFAEYMRTGIVPTRVCRSIV